MDDQHLEFQVQEDNDMIPIFLIIGIAVAPLAACIFAAWFLDTQKHKGTAAVVELHKLD